MSQYEIAVIVGSLRAESFNRKLAVALTRLAPPEFSFSHIQISDLPLYNQDDDANQALPVKRLKKENAELKVEREILRKAAAYFAKETTR